MRVFPTLVALYKHRRSHQNQRRRYTCEGCRRSYASATSYHLHRRLCTGLRARECRLQKWRMARCRPAPSPASDGEWTMRSGVNGEARIHLLHVTHEDDLQLSLIRNRDFIVKRLQKDMAELRRIKWYMSAYVRIQANENVEPENSVRYARCAPQISLSVPGLNEQVEQAITGVVKSFDDLTDEGSKILFERVDKIQLHVAKYSPLKGSSYREVPKWLKKSSKGLVNIKNNDNKCFLYSCLAGLRLPAVHAERVSHYKNRMRELNLKGLSFPVKVDKISIFEKNNIDVSVSVFGLEDEERVIVPLRVAPAVRNRHVNLLLLRGDDEDDADDYHYVLIKDLSRFLSHLTKRKRRLFWCENCLTPRAFKKLHDEHRERCIKHGAQAICMPTGKNCILKFTDYDKQLKHDYAIYCDLESILVPHTTVLPDPARSSTTTLNSHVACGFAYVIVGPDGNMEQEPVLEHGGPNLMKRFLLRLKSEEHRITKLRESKQYKLHMTEESEEAFEKASHCYLCGEVVPRQGVLKVRDHDWTKEKDNYRGAACQGCNLNLKRRDFIPVVMHNLSGYDAHHIISALGELTDGSDLSVIPKNKEKYVSFTWGRLRFLDSFGFLSSSLDALVKDLHQSDLTMLRTIFPDDHKFNLMARKGVYPYKYFDCLERFHETCLPQREAFRNDLTGAEVSEVDYVHAQNVFKVFNMSNLWDYHDLYLLGDTLLLADVMENFRKDTMNHFKLDAIHYYTMPGLSWSAAFLMTREKLELLTSLDEHLLWEEGMRGGIASINERHAVANNPFIPDSYDPANESTYIMYYDANALYAAAMSRPLPVSDFRFLCASEVSEFDEDRIKAIEVNDEWGFLFEVDLEYCTDLHDKHNDYPLAPERLKPSHKNLSPLQKKLQKKFNLPKNCPTEKLIPNLNDKTKYVVYGTTLKLYLELGMKLKKVHRVITFVQKAWLAPFINYNTEMRKKAVSNFQKKNWKGYSNSCFGKTCENLRRRRNLRCTKDKDIFRKLVRSPLFHSFEIFDHGLVAVERRKAKITFNRPAYTGQVILDISKEIMYNFHYNIMKQRYGQDITVLATDTDSLIYKIKTDDVYQDMMDLNQHFDTSDYPEDHALHSLTNKKTYGKFKDEMNGEPIAAFVGLRPKMYAFRRKDEGEKTVGKGIPRSSLRSLTYSDYENVLKDSTEKRVSFTKIGTDGQHHLSTTFATKRGLCSYDDKRYLLKDNIKTLAYGHYKLRTLQTYQDQTDPDSETERDDELDDEGACNLRELVLLLGEGD
ncbi:hypothetical protein ONE63_008132 [Megalurothrips usitatus]|uniref:C2H2-type domain-containing protein n=1 Tax=Megalurothrips usitatus TaxID=439358 RepID=A0AAV7XRS5_9NEOP|nr:hypothetical protein ONE63_008132 [Megalurothrips usitatus]